MKSTARENYPPVGNALTLRVPTWRSSLTLAGHAPSKADTTASPHYAPLLQAPPAAGHGCSRGPARWFCRERSSGLFVCLFPPPALPARTRWLYPAHAGRLPCGTGVQQGDQFQAARVCAPGGTERGLAQAAHSPEPYARDAAVEITRLIRLRPAAQPRSHPHRLNCCRRRGPASAEPCPGLPTAVQL